jgi:hypothetical protein
LFFDSTVAWSFFLQGRDLVNAMSSFWSQSATSWLMNSLPLSESNPVTGNGNSSRSPSTASRIHFDALLRMEPHSVRPELMSVIVRVRANSPLQRRPAVRDGAALQHSGDILELVAGLADGDRVAKQQPRPVALLPFNSNAARAGARYRSTVAALIRRTSSIASGVANGWSRSPASRSSGSHWGSITTKYFPHGIAISFHT